MKIKVVIDGMHCEGCRKSLLNSLSDNKNISNIDATIGSATMDIKDKEDIKSIKKIIKECGFKVVSVDIIE